LIQIISPEKEWDKDNVPPSSRAKERDKDIKEKSQTVKLHDIIYIERRARKKEELTAYSIINYADAQVTGSFMMRRVYLYSNR